MVESIPNARSLQLDGFVDRTAIVTGAARGVGRRIAALVSALGASTAGLDLQLPIIDGVLGIACDVSDEESVAEAFRLVEDELGPATLLVLNAGIYVVEPFEDTTFASWRRTMSVNLDGAFLCLLRALPAMRAARYGRVLALGSSAGITGGKRNSAAYAASKAGLMTLTKAIANEFAAEGITANALAPALIRTAMIDGLPDLVDQIPVGRYGEVDDVAAIAAFLLSAHAAYITGEIVDVNGGFLID